MTEIVEVIRQETVIEVYTGIPGPPGGGGGGGVSDHGALTGLADDDHAQYLTGARHTAITGNPHGTSAADVGALAVLAAGTEAEITTTNAAGTLLQRAGYTISSLLAAIAAAYAALVHGSRHHAGGADAIKLDDLAGPDDNTDLNVSTSAHGLAPKLPGNTTTYLRGDGTYATPSGGSPGGVTNELQRNDGAGSHAGATGVTWTGNQLLVTAQAAATVPLVIKGAASQSANLQSWQNSVATVLACLNSSGQFNAAKYLATSPNAGGMDFTSGYTRLLNYNGVVGVSCDAATGIPILPLGAAFGANYFTRDAALIRVAAAILGIRGATDSAGAALNFRAQSAPASPSANQCVEWVEDNGAGKLRKMILFPTGAALQIAIEP